MLKVLIADDEVKVIQLIRHLLDWSAYDMEIIDSVTDGQAALMSIQKNHPHIVITDIRMPLINGVDLVKLAKEAVTPPPFFIIVSGYSDFEYAQQAIHLGVSDYLLKPIKKKELEQTLLRITQKIETSKRNLLEKNTLIKSLRESENKVKANFLTDVVIKGNTSVLSLPSEQLSREYHLSLAGRYSYAILIHIFSGSSPLTKASGKDRQTTEYRFIISKLKNIIEERLKKLAAETTSTTYQDEIYFLLNSNDDIEADILKELERLRVNLLDFQSIFPSLRIAVGISPFVSGMQALTSQFEAAHLALLDRFYDSNRLIFRASPSDVSEQLSFPDSKTQKNLAAAIELLDMDGFSTLLKKIKNALYHQTQSGSAIKKCYTSIVNVFLLQTQTLQGTTLFSSLTLQDFLTAFDSLYSYDQIWDWLIHYCLQLLQAYTDERKTLEERPIRTAKAYIKNHYADPLSLELVSHEAGFNPAYFSSLFKKVTGQNFMDYVKDVRIDRAKELLVQTNLDIASIANSVGYTDIKYFSKLFKSLTHLSPSDYRKLYG